MIEQLKSYLQYKLPAYTVCCQLEGFNLFFNITAIGLTGTRNVKE